MKVEFELMPSRLQSLCSCLSKKCAPAQEAFFIFHTFILQVRKFGPANKGFVNWTWHTEEQSSRIRTRFLLSGYMFLLFHSTIFKAILDAQYKRLPLSFVFSPSIYKHSCIWAQWACVTMCDYFGCPYVCKGVLHANVCMCMNVCICMSVYVSVFWMGKAKKDNSSRDPTMCLNWAITSFKLLPLTSTHFR